MAVPTAAANSGRAPRLRRGWPHPVRASANPPTPATADARIVAEAQSRNENGPVAKQARVLKDGEPRLTYERVYPSRRVIRSAVSGLTW